MLASDIGRVALDALLRHKLPAASPCSESVSALAPPSLACRSARRLAPDPGAIEGLGENMIWIEAGSRNVNGVRTGTHGETSLTVQDVMAIRTTSRSSRRLAQRGHARAGHQRQPNWPPECAASALTTCRSAPGRQEGSGFWRRGRDASPPTCACWVGRSRPSCSATRPGGSGHPAPADSRAA